MEWLALVSALAGTALQEGRVALAASVPSREQMEADLAIRVAWRDGAPRHRWWHATPAAELVNRSKTASHRVVRTGDGSDVGWREPYVHLTFERLSESSTWTDLKPRTFARCGMYSPYWLDSVVDLGPGESLPLAWLQLSPRSFVDARPHRFSVHYEFRRQAVREDAGGRRDGKPPPGGGLGRMKEWPAFHVVSEPLEVRFDPDDATVEEIVQGLRLRLELEPAARPARWSDLRAGAALQNVSSERSFAFVALDANDAAFPWCSTAIPGEPGSTLEAEQLEDDASWSTIHLETPPLVLPAERDWRRRVQCLDPGATVALSPSRALAPWMRAEESARRVRIRARYRYGATPVRSGRDGEIAYPQALGAMSSVPPFTLASDWVEVELAGPDRR